MIAAVTLASVVSAKDYNVNSPDGRLAVTVSIDEQVEWSLTADGRQIITPSAISMALTDGTLWGRPAKVSKVSKYNVNETLPAILYRSSSVKDNHNSMVLKFKGGWSLEFRVFNDGVAYRFASEASEGYEIASEQAEINFPADRKVFTPYVKGSEGCSFEQQFQNSFENIYTETTINGMKPGQLSFLPLLVDAGDGIKICISEVNLEAYPGMYLCNQDGSASLKGVFAPYPKKQVAGGYNNIQLIVPERESYIAKVDSPRAFPWRMFVVGTDVQIAQSDMTWLLAEPSRIEDASWIRPGKVAWDWWNDWNIRGVDFEAGINTQTYKYYIDFAASKGIEYVILDDGWAAGKGEDLMIINPEINLEEITSYAQDKGVGIILWAGFRAFNTDIEGVCRHYSQMGVKGFKVDFMDRDDQYMTAFNYRAAEIAAKYHLVLDLHGSHKPAGITRTWPNVLNTEGVHGLETVKWTPADVDQVHYDVTIPFIRQVAGPMDYTQGAMRNANRSNFRPINSEPMSQGTRCHQLALYMVLDSPLNMLCDSPSNYLEEPECCDFIASIPTVWDETRVLQGQAGQYILTARRKCNDWFVGGLTDWTGRDMEVDLSFLAEGEYDMVLVRDGLNAERKASDFKIIRKEVCAKDKIAVHLASGGGFAARFEKKAQKLTFRPDGTFKIVQFTDTHFIPNDSRSDIALERINEVLNNEKPDLVIVTGDILYGRPADQAYRTLLGAISSHKIPFAITFGNHDREHLLSNTELYDITRSIPYNLLPDRGDNPSPDYELPIFSSKDGKMKALLYCFDSHTYLWDKKYYETFYPEQVVDYKHKSECYTRRNGGTPVPSLAFMHIPFPEYGLVATTYPAAEGSGQDDGAPVNALVGNNLETVCSPELNGGMFNAMYESADIMGVFAGHDHNNDWAAVYKGIMLAYGRYTGGDTVYNDLPNGARVIVLKEGERKFDTWVVLAGGEKLFPLTYDNGQMRKTE